MLKASLRALLPSHWEWRFIDAELECGPHPQLVDLYPGPYYVAVAIPTVKNLQAFYDWILDVVQEDGPFDGFVGFSAVGVYV